MSSSNLGGAVARTVASSERCSCTAITRRGGDIQVSGCAPTPRARRGRGQTGGGGMWGDIQRLLHDEHEAGEGARGQLGQGGFGQGEHAAEKGPLNPSRLLETREGKAGNLGSRAAARPLLLDGRRLLAAEIPSEVAPAFGMTDL